MPNYFNFDVKATRYNIYKGNAIETISSYAAIKKDNCTQNITIAVSFG